MSMIRFLNTRFEYSLLICATYVGFWMELHIIRPQSTIQWSYYYSYYFSGFESTHLFEYSLLICATYAGFKDFWMKVHIILHYAPTINNSKELLLLLLFLQIRIYSSFWILIVDLCYICRFERFISHYTPTINKSNGVIITTLISPATFLSRFISKNSESN